jgi:hypothetical protein
MSIELSGITFSRGAGYHRFGSQGLLTRFIHRGFETAVPRRGSGVVFGGVGDAAVGV